MLDFEVLKKLMNTAFNVKIEREKSIVFSYDETVFENVKKEITNLDLFEFNDTDKTIKLSVDDINFYKNDVDILSKKNKVPNNKNIIVLSHNDNILSYDFKNKIQNDDKFFIKNLIGYNEFNEALQSEKICDLNETATQKIVLFSDNYGINKIDYSASINLDLDENIDYWNKVEIFKENLNKDEVFVEYLKSEIIKILKDVDYKNQISSLLNSLDYLIDNAKKEFKVYLKKFSFDSLKNELVKSKEKYFSSLREILGKIFTQVIAIPASVTALLIVITKLDTVLIVKVFLGAYTLVSLFALIVQISYLLDNWDLSKEFTKEFKLINEKSGLEKKEIDPEKNKVKRKICLNYVLLVILLLLTIILLVVAYYFGLDRMNELVECKA